MSPAQPQAQHQEISPFYLAGVPTVSQASFDVCCPFDGSLVGRVHRPSAAHLDQACDAAREAFKETRKLSTFQRLKILTTIAHELLAQKEEFARLIALECAKPIKLARGEVDRAVCVFETAAVECQKIGGEVLDIDVTESASNHFGISRRFPIGPIAAVTPFNFPLNLVAHKLAPAIAVGCPIVIKSASQTPLSALRLAKIVIEKTDWPAKALSVLPLSSTDCDRLINDDVTFKMLTFTGSAEVGWELKKNAKTQRVALELGGNAAVVVCGDSDLDLAVAKIATGAFSFSGQSCISVQRVIVQDTVFEVFCEKFKVASIKLQQGHPLSEDADYCCMITRNDAARVDRLFTECRNAGCQFLFGGEVAKSVVTPTAIIGAPTNLKISREEVFAPVVCLYKFQNYKDAIHMVNDSPYGLQAAVFTNDMRIVMDAFENVQVGGLVINDSCSFRSDPSPYGGTKQSGTGREGVKYAIQEMTEVKLLVVNRT